MVVDAVVVVVLLVRAVVAAPSLVVVVVGVVSAMVQVRSQNLAGVRLAGSAGLVSGCLLSSPGRKKTPPSMKCGPRFVSHYSSDDQTSDGSGLGLYGLYPSKGPPL